MVGGWGVGWGVKAIGDGDVCISLKSFPLAVGIPLSCMCDWPLHECIVANENLLSLSESSFEKFSYYQLSVLHNLMILCTHTQSMREAQEDTKN